MPARASRDGWAAERDVVRMVVSVAAGPAKVLKSEEADGQEAIKRWGALRQEKAARNNEGSWGNWIGFDSVGRCSLDWAELRFRWIERGQAGLGG